VSTLILISNVGVMLLGPALAPVRAGDQTW
jgi:hypothetical protein